MSETLIDGDFHEAVRTPGHDALFEPVHQR